jgi:hypothetical protein
MSAYGWQTPDDLVPDEEEPVSCDSCGVEVPKLFTWRCRDFDSDDDVYFCAGCSLKYVAMGGEA